MLASAAEMQKCPGLEGKQRVLMLLCARSIPVPMGSAVLPLPREQRSFHRGKLPSCVCMRKIQTKACRRKLCCLCVQGKELSGRVSASCRYFVSFLLGIFLFVACVLFEAR